MSGKGVSRKTRCSCNYEVLDTESIIQLRSITVIWSKARLFFLKKKMDVATGLNGNVNRLSGLWSATANDHCRTMWQKAKREGELTKV